MKSLSAILNLPLVEQIRDYRADWIRPDIVAGLSIGAVSLPSAIAYPAIAGLPTQTGIFAAVFSMLGYALIGPSRQLMVGPDTGTCIMLAGVFAASGIADAGDRAMTAQLLALLVGLFCFAAGTLRIGQIANFLSRPMLVGFLTGISISLIISQITRLTAVPIDSEGLVRPIVEFLAKIGQIHVPTLLVGLASFLCVRSLQRWVSWAPAPLVAIVAAIALSVLLDFQARGIAVIGALPAIAFDLSVPDISWRQLPDFIGGALAIMLVGFGSGIVTARSFAMKQHADVNADRELVGFGGANIASGLFGGFPVSASDSRTAVNFAIGGRTQLAALVAAMSVAIAVLVLSNLIAYLPQATLGAILLSAAIDLIDLQELRAIRRINPTEFAFSLVTVLGVVIIGVLQGVFIAIAVTLAQLLWTASRPRLALLGRLPGDRALVKLHRYPTAAPIPDMIVVMIQSGIVFFNADYLKQKLLKIARARRATTRWLLIDANAVNILDSTAIAKLDELREEVAGMGIRLCFSELNSSAKRRIQRSGLADRLGPGMLFASTEAAVETLSASSAGDAPHPPTTQPGPAGREHQT
jgi:SulP family sulfate permease